MSEHLHFTTSETVILPLSRLENNTGQIEGLPANPRKIDPDKYERLVQSLTEHPKFLETSPLKVYADPGKAGHYVIIGGNMRRRALSELGYKEVPCAVIAPDTPVEELRAYTIIDNNSYGTWDIEAIEADWDMDELEKWGIDLPDITMEAERKERDAEEDGFSGDDVDNAPTRTHGGELWALGEHRMLVGDSTRPEDMERLTGGAMADLLLTDPPYNVDYQGDTRDRLKIANDKMSDRRFLEFLTAAFRNAAQAMRAGASFYIWHASMRSDCFNEAVRAAGLQCTQLIIWYKNALVLGRSDYQWIHEPCLYGWKEGAAHYFSYDRSQTTVYDDTVDYRKMDKRELLKVIQELTRPSTVPTTVWREDKPARSELHPTMKPVRLFGRSVRNSTRPGDTVLDPFAGSGTAIIACEQLGRRCLSMEYEPRYADAILARWERMTGKKAKMI